MNVIIFGATGMVGQGVLRECLLDPGVQRVVTIGRTATGQRHEKLHEIVHADLLDYSAIDQELRGYDACFFCLGVSSAGMTEQDYRRVTCDITLAAAHALIKRNRRLTFVYVSGAGTASSSRTMWARVKGETENALLQLPFKAAYMFRPAAIQPLHGIRSKTRLYDTLYTLTKPLLPMLKLLLPNQVTTTEQVGRAMIAVARQGARKHILETQDINAL